MKSFEVVFSSNIKEVNKIVRGALEYISSNIPMADREELMEIRLILSELLFNAVIHGNRNNAEKFVKLKINTDGNVINCVISDEGEGFDFGRLSYKNSEPSIDEHGRGIILVKGLVDTFAYSKAGNRILFSKRVGVHV
ncbi:MAG: ATP-binding protein [Clostridiales bacterium]|nr:ATP-binding protein [Clostridiales bacterium]MCD8214680.1 ATP-binding protein [Clostridiales bacterium]